MESQIRVVGLLITFVAIIYALRRGGDMPALVFLALSPLVYFSQNVFIVLSPGKLMGLIFLGVVVLNPRYRSLTTRKYLGAFLPYFLYIFILTIFMPFFWPDYSVTEQSFLYSNTMRGYVQLFQMFMGLAIIVVFIDSLKSAKSLLRAQVTLLVTMALVCVYGIYVWFAQRLGLPYNPINRQGQGDELGRKITALIDGTYRMRAYSLTGEPKTLATNACSGLILSYFTPANYVGFLKGLKGEIFLVSLFLITLLLTLSTAGFLILPIMIFTALVIQVRVGGAISGMVTRLVAMTMIVTPIMYFSGYDVVASVSTIMESRVESKLDDRGMFTYAETAILEFWDDKPYFAISGVGLGGSAFYVREYDTLSYAGFIAAPRGIVGFVSDRGVIGLLLFLMGLLKVSRPLIAMAASKSPNRSIYTGILIISAISVVLMFTKGQWQDEWLAIGLLCAGSAVANRERYAIHSQRGSPENSSRSRYPVR